MDKGQRDATIAALPPADRMAHLIGLVTQKQVQVEFSLRNAWMAYAAGGAARFLVPDRFTELVRQCEVLVRNDTEECERVRSAALAIFAEAKALNEERNRFVHDLWFGVGDHSALPEPAFAFIRFRKYEPHGNDTQRSISDAEALLTRLDRLNTRASMIPYVSSKANAVGEGFAPEHAHFEEQGLRVLEGRFDLVPGGGVSPWTDAHGG